jgi:hypothetical protein
VRLDLCKPQLSGRTQVVLGAGGDIHDSEGVVKGGQAVDEGVGAVALG